MLIHVDKKMANAMLEAIDVTYEHFTNEEWEEDSGMIALKRQLELCEKLLQEVKC